MEQNLQQNMQKVLDHFIKGERVDEAVILSGGAINGTYRVSTDSGRYIIQSINPSVFGGDPEGIDHNYRSFAEALEKARNEEDVSIAVPEWIPDKDGRCIWTEGDRTAWRIYPYIEGDVLDVDSDPDAVRIFAHALADMHRILRYYPGEPETVIPDFHRLDLYYKQYQIAECVNDRDPYCEDLIRSNINYILDNCVFNNETVIHGDTKIQNVLYDRKSGSAAFIDMDTFTKSSPLIDIADSIRSILCRDDDAEADSETADNEAAIDIERMRSFIKEYYREAGRAPLSDELNQLMLAVLRMPFELALRFYTDYLRGNTYFPVQYGEQNLIRAKKQFSTFEQLLNMYDELKPNRL